MHPSAAFSCLLYQSLSLSPAARYARGPALSYPTLYDVTYSYTGFQQAQGDNSFPGTQVDADLAGLEDSVNSIDAFLRTALRSDGKVQNGSVGREAFAPSVFLGFSPPEAWAPLTDYAANISTIFINGKFYSAIVTHVSGATFDASKWVEIADLAAAISYTTPARALNKPIASLGAFIVNAAQEGVPNDGLTDAAAKLQEIVDWAAANRPLGVFIDCSDGAFRLDSPVIVSSSDVVFGGAGPGRLANFHRNHDAGPLFKFIAPGIGATQISRSGLRYCAVRDLGTATNGSGQRTGMFGTWANSPYGVLFETVDQAVIDRVEFYNESLGMFGTPNVRPAHLHWFFNREREVGRIAWNFTGGTLAGTAFPRSSGCWGYVFDIAAGLFNGTTILPSCDYGLVVDQCDGFYLDQFHCQYTQVANVLLPSNTAGRPLYNFGLSNSFLDLTLGKGLLAQGSVPILSLQFSGVVSATRLGAASVGIHVTNPMVGGLFNIERLEGWTSAGVLIDNANAKNITVEVGQAENVGATIVGVLAGSFIDILCGNVNGSDVAGTGTFAAHGVYCGSGAVEVSVSGGRISRCTNGVTIDAGATLCSVTGVNVRNNFSASILDAGTNTFAKGNIGAPDIPVTDVAGPAAAVDGTPAVFDGTTGKLIKNITYAAFKTLLALVKGDVGLGNVDNTSDASKPVSTAQAAADALKANLAGGNTFTGDQVISGAAGTFRSHVFKTGANNRWLMAADNTAESGANAGSDFGVNAYDDAGNFLSTPWRIVRSTGVMQARSVQLAADTGGGTGTNTITGVADVTANSTGVGSIKFKGTTSRDSAGFIKIYIGTTPYYVPVFSAISG
jgi:hypothetical protein